MCRAWRTCTEAKDLKSPYMASGLDLDKTLRQIAKLPGRTGTLMVTWWSEGKRVAGLVGPGRLTLL